MSKRVKLLTDMDRAELEALAAHAVASAKNAAPPGQLQMFPVGSLSTPNPAQLISEAEARFAVTRECHHRLKLFARFVRDFRDKLLLETSKEYVLGVLINFFHQEVKPFAAEQYGPYALIAWWVARRRVDGAANYEDAAHVLASAREHLPPP